MPIMSSFVRESRFRNVEVKVEAREKHYDQIRVSTGPMDGSNCLAASSLYVAYIDNTSAGATVMILPLSSMGKIHNDSLCINRAHSQAVQDLAFDVFNPSILYTCSTDGRLKTWDMSALPTGSYSPSADSGVANEPVSMLSPKAGFSLRGFSQHPTARGIVAVRGTRDMSLLDIESNEEISSTSSGLFKNDLQCLAWSYTGHVLASTAKDKVVRLFDMRLPPESAVIASSNAHTGTRSTSCVWLGNSSYFLSTGHSVMMDREMMIWDERNMSKPLKKSRIDGSTSPIMPFYDNDNNLLILSGKGEAGLRLYETDLSTGEVHSITNTSLGEVFRGAALLPKQTYDLMACEVLRVLKLTETSIQPVSFTVPRKERRKFHDDLYPATSNGSSPSLTSIEYKSGENKGPMRIEVAPGFGSKSAESNIKANSNEAEAEEPAIVNNVPSFIALSAIPSEPIVSSTASTPVAAYNATNSLSDATASELSPKSPSTSARSSVYTKGSRSSVSYTSMLKYRYMNGIENPKTSTFYNLLPQTTYSDSPLIAASDKYWAIPYQGGGGPVYVSKLHQYGKVEPGVGVLNGHKAPVQDISFSPFHSGLLATGSSDSTINIWQLPEGVDSQDEMQDVTPLTGLEELAPVNTITGHINSVKSCAFHPVIESMVVSSSLDQTVRLFDVNAGSEISKISIEVVIEASYANNLAFNYDGSLISVACKDRVIRILDPRGNKTVISTPSGSVLGRNLMAIWCYAGPQNNSILSVSAASTGMRLVHMWDVRTMNEPLSTLSVDNAAGQLFPIFDEDTGMCVLAGKGDTSIRFFELTIGSAGAVCLKSCEYQSSKDPIVGICMLPKRLCDAKEVEALKFLTLTSDSVIPISFRVPRAENLKQYFQDDIFPPTRSKTSGGTITEWIASGEDGPLPTPSYDSMQPEGMKKSSERPAEVQTKRQSTIFREEIEKQEAESKQREDTFSKLQSLAIQRSKYHPNPSNSGKVKGEVAPIDEDSGSENDWDD